MFDNQPGTANAATSVAATGPTLPTAGERRSVYYIEDIYDPDKHSDADAYKYLVPIEGSKVLDIPNGLEYWAYKVGNETSRFKTELRPWINGFGVKDDDTTEMLEGLPGGFNGIYTLFVDYSVLPPVAWVDQRVTCPNAAYALLYEGNTVGSVDSAISVTYNANKVIENKQVPVKLMISDKYLNKTIMTTMPFSVVKNAEALPDGSRATLVFYDQGGTPIPPPYHLDVQHSAFYRDHNMGQRYVREVELLAPYFMNSNDPELLYIPMFTALTSIEFRARVWYNDGSWVDHTVDGTRMVLFGLQQHKPLSPGQESELTLHYLLADNEEVELATPGSPRHKSKRYRLQGTPPQGSWLPRIFTYPVPDETGGYSLKHYHYDLDRAEVTDITDAVVLNDKSPVFNTTRYGIEQNMIFTINLAKVKPTYPSLPHIQYTTITLLKSRTEVGRKWSIRHSTTENHPAYESLPVKPKRVGNNYFINLAQNATTLDEWLGLLYRSVEPMVNPADELVAPTPTHFDFCNKKNEKWRFPVGAWNTDMAISFLVQTGETYFIRWVKVLDTGKELQLAMTAVYGDVL